jgi:hypothetical protein
VQRFTCSIMSGTFRLCLRVSVPNGLGAAPAHHPQAAADVARPDALIEYKGSDEGDWNLIEWDLLTGIGIADIEGAEVLGVNLDDGPWTCEKIFEEAVA